MAEPIIIQLIADYGVGDPAFAEVVQKLTFLDKDIRVDSVSVPPFSTVATGLWIYQFATVNAFAGLVVFSNTAPRIKLSGFDEPTDGGRLVYTKLGNGTMVIAVNTGYCLSFIKPLITDLHLVNTPNAGSQFRSRDYYPDTVVGIAHGQKEFFGEELDASSIVNVPNNLVAFVDGYGNLKTTMRSSENKIPVGVKVKITVADQSRYGIVSDETYRVADGEISFAPGSTGGKDRFMEIWVRGGSAWEEFKRPKVETVFNVKPVA